MYNYLIKIEYDGTKFVGWQHQNNGVSIQETIEKALKKFFKLKIKIVGAGRTDKGVHALSQNANFLMNKKIEDEKKFLNSINFFLKNSLISLIDIKLKKLDFHARFHAKERIYEYLIINRIGSLALKHKRAWHVKRSIDIRVLKKGGKILEGKHDFSTFRASACSAKSPIKKMNTVRVKKQGDKIYILFKSKSFLQNQVRSMVGCLNHLGTNKWSLAKFKKVFKSKNRLLCAPPAPAHGLYLKKVVY